MAQRKPRHTGGRERGSELSLWTADNSDHTADARQINRLVHRFGLSRALAGVVAELAFGPGGRVHGSL